MTESIIRQALRDSVNEVLEKMFFVQTLGEASCSESAGPAASDEIVVRLAFQGKPPGSLTLRLTAAAGRPIAAAFLGTDEEEVSDVQIAEVVCELANMICGSVLSRVESATTFHLLAPQLVPPSEGPAGGPCTTRYAVELSNGKLTVNVTTRTPCPQPVQFAC